MKIQFLISVFSICVISSIKQVMANKLTNFQEYTDDDENMKNHTNGQIDLNRNGQKELNTVTLGVLNKSMRSLTIKAVVIRINPQNQETNIFYDGELPVNDSMKIHFGSEKNIQLNIKNPVDEKPCNLTFLKLDYLTFLDFCDAQFIHNLKMYQNGLHLIALLTFEESSVVNDGFYIIKQISSLLKN